MDSNTVLLLDKEKYLAFVQMLMMRHISLEAVHINQQKNNKILWEKDSEEALEGFLKEILEEEESRKRKQMSQIWMGMMIASVSSLNQDFLGYSHSGFFNPTYQYVWTSFRFTLIKHKGNVGYAKYKEKKEEAKDWMAYIKEWTE